MININLTKNTSPKKMWYANKDIMGKMATKDKNVNVWQLALNITDHLNKDLKGNYNGYEVRFKAEQVGNECVVNMLSDNSTLDSYVLDSDYEDNEASEYANCLHDASGDCTWDSDRIYELLEG